MEHIKRFAESLNENEKTFLMQHMIQDFQSSKTNAKQCAGCGSQLPQFSGYSLEFGDNIRMRASFCAKDCLEYFIKQKMK